MERFIEEIYIEHYDKAYDYSGSFSTDRFRANREAYTFEYISNLLERKNFEAMEETVSLMDFEELERMKPKSSGNIRHVLRVEPETKENNVSHHSFIVPRTSTGLLTKTKSHSTYAVSSMARNDAFAKRSKSVNDAQKISKTTKITFKTSKTLERSKSLQSVNQVSRPNQVYCSLPCLRQTSSPCKTGSELELEPFIDSQLLKSTTNHNSSVSCNDLIATALCREVEVTNLSDAIESSEQSSCVSTLSQKTERCSKTSNQKRYAKRLKKCARKAFLSFASFFQMQLRYNNTFNCLLFSA